jgi:hypothetical protein
VWSPRLSSAGPALEKLERCTTSDLPNKPRAGTPVAQPARVQAARNIELVHRLSRQSVNKHFDAYEDVDWDAPSNQILHDDPRWELPDSDPLGATAWYRNLPPPVRARLGLHLIVQQMRVGMIFEGVLSRGLLEFATTREPSSAEMRYAYHEVIEECQHSLMFREFVVRSGLHVPGLSKLDEWGAHRVPRLGRKFPELFFVFVLGGEVPIDGVQKRTLERRHDIHPLLKRVIQIHVTEEARHLAFARTYLRDRVPALGALRRTHLRLHTPFILAVMTKQMLEPPKSIIREYRIPEETIREAYYDDPERRKQLLAHLEPLVSLAIEVGIVTRSLIPLWKQLKIWPLG